MENIYKPFTQEEYIAIKNDLAGITHTLPTHLSDIFWSRCNAIRGTNTPPPCATGCGGAAAHWGACVAELQNYVKQIDGQQ
jgi:hypothetical protein